MATKMYRATVASIRAVYGKRLRQQQYRTMMAMHTVPEIAAFLKNTPAYRQLLADMEPSVVHRGYLESALRRAVFHQYLHFCKLEQLQSTPFFRFVIMDYEVREILKAIQLLPQQNDSYITAMFGWLAPYTEFSLDALAKADSYDEILDALKHTVYHDILKPFLRNEQQPFPYLECEIALRAGYLEHLLEQTKRVMKGKNRTALEEQIRQQIDLVNLINAYRLKSVFHSDRDTLRALMLPVQGNLPKRISNMLYDAPDADAFRRVLMGTRYGRMLSTHGELPQHLQMEHCFQVLRCRTARNALRFSDHAAVSLYAMHYLQSVEAENLTTIIEGIRYQKPIPYLESLLILDI